MLSSRYLSSSSKLIGTTTTNSVHNLSLLFSAVRFASASSSSSALTPSLYDRLGLPSTASTEEIKKNYKKKALQCHPDIVQSSASMTRVEKAKAEAEFRGIAEAYETLSNTKKRATYDLQNGFYSSSSSSSSVSKKKSTTTTTTATKTQKSSQYQEKKTTTKRKAAHYSGPASPIPKAPKKARTGSQKSAGSSSPSSPFLSKDAQRVFREAFEGKSVHDVLFSKAYSSKYGTKDAKKQQQQEQQQESVLNDDNLWQQFMNGTKEELSQKFREQHPYADPKDYGFGMRKSFHLNPDQPPAEKFPFRPCSSLKFPDHIHPGDEVSTLEPQKINFTTDQVENVSMEPASGYREGEDRRGEAWKMDDPDEYQRTLRNYRLPQNEGVVWSFRRKY